MTNRAKKIAAGTSLILGLAVLGSAVILDALEQAIAGLALVCAGLAAWIPTAIDHAIRDTSAERAELARLMNENVMLQEQYIAARAVLDNGRERLVQEMARVEREAAETIAAEKQSLRANIESERDALRLEFEQQRSTLKLNAYQQGLDHGERGITLEGPTVDAIVIQLPVPAIGSGRTKASQGANSPS
ncbi:MAG: hypothetical protein HOZ81_50460 [Streptomyces sp.]|nr:hypothetical protein [Streptomyces sp.]NUS24398.1 hypothetical protein [Streptomyces sp.]